MQNLVFPLPHILKNFNAFKAREVSEVLSGSFMTPEQLVSYLKCPSGRAQGHCTLSRSLVLRELDMWEHVLYVHKTDYLPKKEYREIYQILNSFEIHGGSRRGSGRLYNWVPNLNGTTWKSKSGRVLIL